VVAGSRREARERALELLYEADARSAPIASVIDGLVAADPFVVGLVQGVDDTLADVDGWIERFARGWTIDRMPVVDRAILRIAIYELVSAPTTPTGVVISEAVELAKRYSTDDSGRFVNGVLASVAAEVRPTTTP
jgi:N utilization substance protein B